MQTQNQRTILRAPQVRDLLAAESTLVAESAVANATAADRAQREAVFSQLAAVAGAKRIE